MKFYKVPHMTWGLKLVKYGLRAEGVFAQLVTGTNHVPCYYRPKEKFLSLKI